MTPNQLKEIAVYCRNEAIKKTALQFLESQLKCRNSGYPPCPEVNILFWNKNDKSIWGHVYFEGEEIPSHYRQRLIIPFEQLIDENYLENLTIPITFNSFHKAQINKKGIRFPWREAIFPLGIVKSLIAAKKKIAT